MKKRHTLSRRTSLRALAVPLAAALGIANPARAQVSLPDMPNAAAGRSVLPITAAEGAYHVSVQEARAESDVSIYDAGYPLDSINKTVMSTGARWLADIRAKGAKGIQLDPAGKVGVAAQQESYANEQIAARLATPNLSFVDSAYALMVAVNAFADEYYPAHLPIAERYLERLDAMGDSAALWQIRARSRLVSTYFRLGRTPDVIKHGARALGLVNALRFNERGVIFITGTGLYTSTVAALAGQPGGRARIDSLNTLLKAATVTPPAWLAIDSSFSRFGAMYEGSFQFVSSANALVGKPGAPMVSNYWVNRPSHDSATIALNDGKIRLFELAGLGCAPCLAALQSVQRLGRKFPDIETYFFTATSGAWGNRFVEPDEEAGLIADFLLNTSKITMPIGIWKAPKVMNVDGGMTPGNAGPMFGHYPTVKMSAWLVDGKGVVRRYFDGITRKDEPEIARMINYLLQEAKNSSASTAASADSGSPVSLSSSVR